MQLSEDILLYIGQKYLKDKICIRKLFYHNKDDKLQVLLFGEVLHHYKLFSKTTVPLCYLTKFSHRWFSNNLSRKVPRSIEAFDRRWYKLHIDRMFIDFSKLKSKCDILITFESWWDDESLDISIEYIDNNNCEVLYTIKPDDLQYCQPNIYKKLKQLIFKKIIN